MRQNEQIDALSATLPPQAFFNQQSHSNKWAIMSRQEKDLNIYYEINVAQPGNSEFYIDLPWFSQTKCNFCQASGYIYSWEKDNICYTKKECAYCKGCGVLKKQNTVKLLINKSLTEMKQIRKKGAGLLEPHKGRQGDMIIKISWL